MSTTSAPTSNLSAWLKSARSEAGISLKTLADELDVTTEEVEAWESGAVTPTLASIQKLKDRDPTEGWCEEEFMRWTETRLRPDWTDDPTGPTDRDPRPDRPRTRDPTEGWCEEEFMRL